MLPINAVPPANTTCGKECSYLDKFKRIYWKFVLKLCITVQLSHFPSKFGTGDIYQVIYLESLDLLIELYLGEKRGGEILHINIW